MRDSGQHLRANGRRVSRSRYTPPPITRPPVTELHRPDDLTVRPCRVRFLQTYRSSARTAAVLEFACARAATPLWVRMLYFVRFDDSSAMLASRIRLSAA